MLGAFFACIALGPAPVFACATCYGQVDSPMTEGMNWGIGTLLGILLPVLATFLFFFIHLIRKSEALANAPQPNSPDV